MAAGTRPPIDPALPTHAAKRVGAALVLLTFLAMAMPGRAQQGPVFSPTGPDADAYGAQRNYPEPPPGTDFTQETMVGFFSHYDHFTTLRVVPRGAAVSVLKRATEEIVPTYRYEGALQTVAAHLKHSPVTGLLVARDDTILLEHYQYARTDRDRMLSQSMVKTLVGMLVGIALSEGRIRSIDDLAMAYVPELAGTAYGETPIRALLRMSSGVAFSENEPPGEDLIALHRALVRDRSMGAAQAVKMFDRRVAAPGTRHSYASAETEVLGLIVSRAANTTLADYLSTRIWQKLGAESDAAWAIDSTGQEVAYCCFIAVLRDWARLGLMLAHDGRWNGQQIVPRQWLLDATTLMAEDAYLRAPTGWGYGYQVLLLPGDRRAFALLGRNGQIVLVDPLTKLVMVQTAARLMPIGDPRGAETLALWSAIVSQYSGK